MNNNSKIHLQAHQLVKRFGTRTVVDNVNIELEAGEIVGLLGPNGAGKTTTFNMVVGFLKPNSGNIIMNGQDITQVPIYKRARMGIGYLPQEKSVFQKLSVYENLMAIAEIIPGMKKDERRKKVQEVLEELKMDHLKDSPASTLSGGERRRVEIGRALVHSPHFLLLDEPFSGVDPIAVADLQAIIFGLQKKEIGILITDHSVRETLDVVNRAYLLHQGKILLSGTSRELVDNPKARQFYLGEKFYIKEEV